MRESSSKVKLSNALMDVADVHRRNNIEVIKYILSLRKYSQQVFNITLIMGLDVVLLLIKNGAVDFHQMLWISMLTLG